MSRLLRFLLVLVIVGAVLVVVGFSVDQVGHLYGSIWNGVVAGVRSFVTTVKNGGGTDLGQ